MRLVVPISCNLHLRPAHHVGNAEGAADLDQFAARHHGFLALRQRVECQQYGSGVVVDDGRRDVRRTSANQFGEQAGHQIVAVPAPAGSQVVLKRARRAGRIDHGGDGFLGELGAAEIGVQDGAGQIEDGAQIGPAGFVGTATNGRQQACFVGERQTVLQTFAGGGQFGTDATGDQLAAVRFDQFGNLLQDAVDRG